MYPQSSFYRHSIPNNKSVREYTHSQCSHCQKLQQRILALELQNKQLRQQLLPQNQKLDVLYGQIAKTKDNLVRKLLDKQESVSNFVTNKLKLK